MACIIILFIVCWIWCTACEKVGEKASKAINKKTLSQHEKFYLLPYDKEQKLSVDSNNNVKY